MITALAILTFLYFSARCKSIALRLWVFITSSIGPDEINAYIANTFTDREIADYGLTSLYFTRKDFIKWWMPA